MDVDGEEDNSEEGDDDDDEGEEIADGGGDVAADGDAGEPADASPVQPAKRTKVRCTHTVEHMVMPGWKQGMLQLTQLASCGYKAAPRQRP